LELYLIGGIDMCGGGSSGPSSAELVAQENASKARAQAEADRLKAERDLNKQQENAKIVADQVGMANADAARRAKNRTLLAGLASEEGDGLMSLEDSQSKSSKKAKRATLIAPGGS
jgi:regulator of protease activity HflC (stomatin/prohibitin superfamily)